MNQFVQISKKEFLDWASEELPNHKQLLPNIGRELVFSYTLPNGLEIHVYSTLEGENTRSVGEDAIRCVLYDPKSKSPVGTTKKVLRSEGKTSPLTRLSDRILELVELSESVTFCKKCGSHLIERLNRKTQETFLGCSAYPTCPDLSKIIRKHPLRDPALELKPKIDSYYQDNFPEEKKKLVIPETDLVEELVPTANFNLIKYSFPEFNRVQSTLLKNVGYDADVNLVLGTSTSSGKTICAELFMASTLDQGKVVVYVSPLKSLTQEKYNDWQATFPEQQISILTGDYIMTPAREKELNQANIVCLTSEMTDSLTRKAKSERSSWLKKVGLIVIDESHLIGMEGRGHAVEAGIVRFSSLIPSARILMLSATMPNVSEFETWLTVLNGKTTKVINNSWRPTQLDWHFIEHGAGTYTAERDYKMSLALELVKSKPEEKFLVFVHDKNTGRLLEGLMHREGISTKFLNADLTLEDKISIEKGFRERGGGDRVMIATSVVAWGVSMPARNVIIVGTTRGINEVDELDIIQMGGRAGRMNIDPRGDVYLICKYPGAWSYKIKNPRNVTSTLLNKGVLGFHVLAEIKTGNVYDMKTLTDWFNRTLAKIQGVFPEELFLDTLRSLEKWGMVVVSEIGHYKITPLGRISAELYYLPQDIFHWSITFGKIHQNELWDNDLAIAYSLGSVPSWQLGYIPKDSEERVRRFTQEVLALPGFDNAYSSSVAADAYDLIVEFDTRISMRSVQYDAPRICQALSWIDKVKGWKQEKFWNTLQLRIKYGARAEIASLCGIPGIGVARARKLFTSGIKEASDLLLPENDRKVYAALGKAAASKVKSFVAALEKTSRHSDEEEYEMSEN